jgi:deoxyhypusine synthase
MGEQRKEEHLTIDSVRDFRELTEIKLAVKNTGIVIVAGGVPRISRKTSWLPRTS